MRAMAAKRKQTSLTLQQQKVGPPLPIFARFQEATNSTLWGVGRRHKHWQGISAIRKRRLALTLSRQPAHAKKPSLEAEDITKALQTKNIRTATSATLLNLVATAMFVAPIFIPDLFHR